MGVTISNSLEYIEADKLIIALADMPFVQVSTFNQVCAALREHEIVVPTFQGQRGHPVGFQRQYFSELAELDGDSGGRSILKRHADKVFELPVDDPGVLYDIDTEADLSSLMVDAQSSEVLVPAP
jgi:molybdenum cofactor cytidylyltransferase